MSNAKSFLQDLYGIDPSLQEHEAELLPLIEQLLASDPGLAPDKDFVAALQVSLREHAAVLASGTGRKSSLWNNLLFALGGMTATTAAFVIGLSFWQNSLPTEMNTALAPTQDAKTASPLFAYGVEDAKPQAFGSLAGAAQMARSQSGGGGGGVPMVASNPVPAVEATGDAGPVDAKMIAPWPMIRYNYQYAGELPDLQANVDVYKRTPNANRIPLSGLISSLNLGMIDLGSFSGMNVQSISLNQDRDYGYQLYVDLQNAQVSLNAQWDKWPMGQCQDQACWDRLRVKMSDMLSDDRLSDIAKAFLTEHGIDLSHYGDPVVDNAWRRDYERASDKSMAYIPDSQRVIFPLLVDGETVYDQSGIPTGMSVGINVKEKRVTDVYGIGDHTYQKSAYAGVTDEAAIKKYLGSVDNYPVGILYREGVADAPKQETVTVTLGAPTVELATFYTYTNGKNDELLVPSLVFPVEKVSDEDTMFYRQTVVIPLAKEIFDQQNTMGQPMPLEDGPAIMPAIENQEAPTPEVMPRG